MYLFCSTQIKKIKFFLIRPAEMKRVCTSQDERYARGNTVPGTQSFHQFLPINSNTIGYKRISSDQLMHGQYEFGARPTNINEIKENKYVAAVYDEDWYIGLVEEVDKNKQECMINFMHPKMSGNINWPRRPDKCMTPISSILTPIDVPASTSIASRSYSISKQELEKINEMYADFISKKH